MKVNFLICEDDIISLQINKTYIEEQCKIEHVKCNIYMFSNVTDINNKFLSENKIDIACLDIDLGYNKTGLELAEEIKKYNEMVAVIFITSHNEFIHVASKLMFSYLEKPIVQQEMQQKLKRAIIYVEGIKTHKKIYTSLTFKVGRQEISILQESIIYIEKVGRKITIGTIKKNYEVSGSISNLEKLLDPVFVKIDQGIIVNIQKVNVVERNVVYMNTGENFKISRSRIKTIKEQFSNYTNDK
ncbi:LytR/AlgR family response regulator transcription factor [Anaeromicropila populeti]|uniref:Stage 0 sporulation protein A homolog n=1 Tax=Anaeromicropila populeti TaxID=37658 RepID=A0A1I6LWZ2_9FIRM|nr:LytTR family DNA-binding domain-containing protein [Anaeromicropila populeti]SFS07930.1 two component transcriptional regulator, LytTR family [Anaeromicropila populeti]